MQLSKERGAAVPGLSRTSQAHAVAATSLARMLDSFDLPGGMFFFS
jgi:hypothetical protein